MRPCSRRVHRLTLVLKNDLHALMRLKIVLWASVRWLFYITSLVVKPWREDRVTYLRPEQRRVEVLHHVLTRHRFQPKEVSTCPYLHPSLLWDFPLLGENRALIYALLPSSICFGSTPSNAQLKKELIKVQQPQPHPFLRIGIEAQTRH